MFSACWSRCEKILRGGGGSGRNRTHDLLITLQASYHYRSPRLRDGYGWFDSHNSRMYCVDLSINDLFKIITSTKLFNISNPPNLNSICHRSNFPENGAIVAGAIIAGAFIVGAIIAGAFIVGAIIAGAIIAGAIVAGAIVVGVNIVGAFVAEQLSGSNCRLHRSNCRRSNYRRSICHTFLY